MKTTSLREVDLIKESVERHAKAAGDYYDRAMLKMFKSGMSLFYTGKFRNKRVPRYLRIKIPVIDRHYCYEDGESGWLITTKEIKLFRIGTEVVKVPVMRKFKKGETMKFRRHSTLKK